MRARACVRAYVLMCCMHEGRLPQFGLVRCLLDGVPDNADTIPGSKILLAFLILSLQGQDDVAARVDFARKAARDATRGIGLRDDGGPFERLPR